MAATAEAARLTEAHRVAQVRLGLQTVARMRLVWPLIDGGNLDGSFQRWLAAATPIVQAQRATSARTSAAYLAAFKAVELGAGARRPPISLSEAAPRRALNTSMLVTGPVSVKRNVARGMPLVRALSTAETTSAAAALRHALDGGRETIARTVAADRDAFGWARVASGKACGFCSMLADRGAVYSEDTADFAAHDGCSCSAEPVYRL